MEFTDQTITCVDCGTDFIFTAGEQEFFHTKQYTNPRKRCKDCKAKRNSINGTQTSNNKNIRVSCSSCGVDTTVPFVPLQGKPVYCRSCFQKTKGEAVPADRNLVQEGSRSKR